MSSYYTSWHQATSNDPSRLDMMPAMSPIVIASTFGGADFLTQALVQFCGGNIINGNRCVLSFKPVEALGLGTSGYLRAIDWEGDVPRDNEVLLAIRARKNDRIVVVIYRIAPSAHPAHVNITINNVAAVPTARAPSAMDDVAPARQQTMEDQSERHSHTPVLQSAGPVPVVHQVR